MDKHLTAVLTRGRYAYEARPDHASKDGRIAHMIDHYDEEEDHRLIGEVTDEKTARFIVDTLNAATPICQSAQREAETDDIAAELDPSAFREGDIGGLRANGRRGARLAVQRLREKFVILNRPQENKRSRTTDSLENPSGFTPGTSRKDKAIAEPALCKAIYALAQFIIREDLTSEQREALAVIKAGFRAALSARQEHN